MSGEPSLRRTEAKAYFANERTFLHWLNMSVTIGSIAAAMSGIAGHAHRKWGDDSTSGALVVRLLSLLMLVLSILIAVWAGYNFNNRANMLTLKADGPYDSRFLPATLAICLVSALMVVFSGAVIRLHSET